MFMVAADFLTTCQTVFSEMPSPHGLPARYIENFHDKFREECLNEHWFLTLDDARETIESWRIDYNQVRPHSALGYLTPEEFATGYANVEAKNVSHFA